LMSHGLLCRQIRDYCVHGHLPGCQMWPLDYHQNDSDEWADGR